MDLSTSLYQFNKKLKVLWVLFKYSFLQNLEVSIDKHPSGSYQVWLDTSNPLKGLEEDTEDQELIKWAESLES